MITTDVGFEFEAVQFDPQAEAYRFDYDQTTESPSLAAVAALAQVLEADPVGLPPLGRVVDTDALDALFETSPGSSGDLQAGFDFQGQHVRVETGGVVRVAPATENTFDGTVRGQ